MSSTPNHSPVLPRMYTELADWFHLITAPEDYGGEWSSYKPPLFDLLGRTPRDLLELGSGGGNLASHYKRDVPSCVLTDLSPPMLALSRKLNPACEHLEGDMRSLRLGRRFDIVLVHDAIMYMTTENDLFRAMETAFAHCRPGGAAMFIPDFTREIFRPKSDIGGHDGEDRAMRYVEWCYDPDPGDTQVTVEFAYILREKGKATRALYDQHLVGLFGESTWLELMRRAGFAPTRRTGPGDGSTADVFFLGYAP